MDLTTKFKILVQYAVLLIVINCWCLCVGVGQGVDYVGVIKEFEGIFDQWASMERDEFDRYIESMTDDELLKTIGYISTLIEYEGSIGPFCSKRLEVHKKSENTPKGYASPAYYLGSVLLSSH